ncbi:hypothetical protein KCP91_14885 [Microvirga sp. SRT01]|jgi:hypothetical protein|uniref:DUF6894 domain-containing protein n=1 Tax=Sphingomonas longa TaxID=2778730 RepID=A0ABS2DC90_9SPHN|nr:MULTISPECIES: hypothetical protein [Alphaproteobacteria]MBM6577666.1 hypothetical protein [Sphingomonas sp. BT552]MBR7710709.1 hypothetical protein [Microvirga sp. SRT01]
MATSRRIIPEIGSFLWQSWQTFSAWDRGVILSHERCQRIIMPRFFFHTQTDSRMTDFDGYELATASEARQQAIQTCGQMMIDAADAFWGSRPWSITVTNAEGLILWEIIMDGSATPASRDLT